VENLTEIRADVGRLGGQRRSEAKARSSRANGKLGGRPRTLDSRVEEFMRQYDKHEAEIAALPTEIRNVWYEVWDRVLDFYDNGGGDVGKIKHYLRDRYKLREMIEAGHRGDTHFEGRLIHSPRTAYPYVQRWPRMMFWAALNSDVTKFVVAYHKWKLPKTPDSMAEEAAVYYRRNHIDPNAKCTCFQCRKLK
jgi:hypothetical protein